MMKQIQKTICQSCGSPLRMDLEHGKERNGVYSESYCRRCYQLGAFTEPKMTVEKMRENIRAKMIEMRFPRYLALQLADKVYTLQRWVVPPPGASNPLLGAAE